MALFNGIDYAFLPHPGIADMKAAGVHFVGRYVSSDPGNDINGKNLVPAEAAALHAAKMPIILFAEEGSGAHMLAGHPAGVTDAKHFDSVVKALGMVGAIMYCTADFDAAASAQANINAYLDGAASVIGRDRTGLYGGYFPVMRALDAGKVTYAVQTLAWSGAPQRHDPHTIWDGQTNWDSRAKVRQHLQIRIGGASVDLDGAMFSDYGQWPRPAAPVPPPTSPIEVEADGTLSWRDLAHKHGCSLQRSVWLTAINTPTAIGGFPQPRLSAIVRAGAWNDLLPGPSSTIPGVRIWVG